MRSPSIAILLYLFLFLSCLLPSSSNFISDLVCPLVNCVKGKCVESNAALLGFDCQCNKGWKQIEIGGVTLPPCILPNCTLDFGCGSETPSPPTPPLPKFDINNSCSYTFCGDGTCIQNGTGHICDCNEGASNILNYPGFVCLKQCALGADCSGLGFVVAKPPPPPPPPLSHSDAPKAGGNGFTHQSNISRKVQGLTILVFLAIFIPCI